MELLNYACSFIEILFLIIVIVIIAGLLLSFILPYLALIASPVLLIISALFESIPIKKRYRLQNICNAKKELFLNKLKELNDKLNDKLRVYILIFAIAAFFTVYVINDKISLHTNLKYTVLCKISNKEKLQYLKNFVLSPDSPVFFTQKADEYFSQNKKSLAILYYSLAIENNEKNLNELYYKRGKAKLFILKENYEENYYPKLLSSSFEKRRELRIIKEIEDDFQRLKDYKKEDINLIAEFWAFYGNREKADKILNAMIKKDVNNEYLYYCRAIARTKANYYHREQIYEDLNTYIKLSKLKNKPSSIIYNFYFEYADIKSYLNDYQGAIDEHYNTLKYCSDNNVYKNNYKYKKSGIALSDIENKSNLYLPEWIDNREFLKCKDYNFIRQEIMSLEEYKIKSKNSRYNIPFLDER